MCGSLAAGSVDHYLPKDAFPEYSVFAPNLVPACPFCNSNAKGTVFKGVHPERFVHPYFDKIFEKASWYVEIHPPFEAAKFTGAPLGTVASGVFQIVSFHLKHVLKKDFLGYMDAKLAAIPQMLRDRFPFSALSGKDLSTLIDEHRRFCRASTGPNSWDSALWRGVHFNATLQDFIVREANKCNVTVAE